jgi:hypothetical protein
VQRTIPIAPGQSFVIAILCGDYCDRSLAAEPHAPAGMATRCRGWPCTPASPYLPLRQKTSISLHVRVSVSNGVCVFICVVAFPEMNFLLASPRGSQVAYANQSYRTLFVWNIETGALLHDFSFRVLSPLSISLYLEISLSLLCICSERIGSVFLSPSVSPCVCVCAICLHFSA